MRTNVIRKSALALATAGLAAGLAVAAPAPASAAVRTADSEVAVASGIVIGSIETDDCTYTLVLDWDGFHVEETCVTVSF